METDEKCELLADEIKAIISEGMVLSDDVVHYIDSTFSYPTIDELQAILADESNCEADTLIELLFFPGESIQVRLEKELERCRPQKEDENKIIKLLCRAPLPVTFRFTDDRGALTFPIPEDVIRQFIVRLKISKHLDARLIDSIQNYGDEKNTTRFKVKIRNSRFLPSESKTAFLCRFFDKIGSQSNDIFECLEFVLGFLDEIKNGGDIYQALMAKKKLYFISLQKAKKMDARIEKHNIETLLMQGERVTLIDQAEIHKNMQIIDRISRAIYGKTEYFDQPFSEEGQFNMESPDDIKSIVNKFTSCER
jgi:hypothetical protein